MVPTNPCTEFLLKGYVRQDIAWLQNFTVVNITIAAGAVQDCSGRDFPGAEVSAYIQNGSALSSFIKFRLFNIFATLVYQSPRSIWIGILVFRKISTCITYADRMQQASSQVLGAHPAFKKLFFLSIS